jgi:hypothetical protein
MHAEAVEAFFRIAVRPACNAIAAELAALPRTGSNAEMDRWENLRTVQIATHQSFALATAASWERGLREQMYQAAVILVKDRGGGFLKDIKEGNWEALRKAFRTIRGFGLEQTPSYRELNLLYEVATAVRHGDGRAADTVHDLRPDLFRADGVRTGWWAYFAEGGDGAKSVKRLDISLDQLETFRDAVSCFWRFLADIPREQID